MAAQPLTRVKDNVRRLLSPASRRTIARGRVQLRRPSSGARMLPDFLVIGAQRSGTSSLYRYLGRHPDVLSPLRKETEYFSREYRRGLEWYRAHFPLEMRRSYRERVTQRRTVTFEATPDYLFYPPAPGRAAALVPDAKILVLLRDPVDRAFSHYRHMARLGFEHLSFEEALAAERDRIDADLEGIGRDPAYYARDFLRFSYVSRGMYADQLESWMEAFSKDRLMIVQSEAFFDRTADTYAEILEFLGLPLVIPEVFPNAGYTTGVRQKHRALTAATRDSLRDLFAPHNERLYRLLGRRLAWDG